MGRGGSGCGGVFRYYSDVVVHHGRYHLLFGMMGGIPVSSFRKNEQMQSRAAAEKCARRRGAGGGSAIFKLPGPNERNLKNRQPPFLSIFAPAGVSCVRRASRLVFLFWWGCFLPILYC